MNDLLWKLPLCALVAWLLLSSVAFLWWCFDAKFRRRFRNSHPRLAVAVFIGTFLVTFVILCQGIEPLLFFIPAHWGRYDDEEQFVTWRRDIALWLALSCSFFLVWVFVKLDRLRDENRKLTIAAEIESRKRHAAQLSLDSLIQEENKTRAALECLQKRSCEGLLSEADQAEMEVLDELLRELHLKSFELRP